MQHDHRSHGQPQSSTMTVERDVKVAMRDGVRISLCVYRPADGQPAPVLLAASPYQHEFDNVPAFPLFPWRETGPVEWYVADGYAYVHADVRGSGQSEGEFGFMDRTEQEDYVELIAWIARQPWCTGKIGGIGQSYYAMAQWLMATMNPPGLACIVPYDGLVDQYRCSNYHGGIFCNYRSSWYAELRADNLHRPAGKRGRPPMRFDLFGAITEQPLYDAHLKGIDNGFMHGEPVRLFIRGTDVWREEPEWPLARAKYVPYYLRKGPSGIVTSLNDGGLSTEPPAADEPATSYSYPDWEWMNGVVVTGPDGRP